MANDAPILLIHGGCHRGDCWRLLIPALQALGREAVAIDLPGHGRDPETDPLPRTLDDGIAATLAALRTFDRPALLVGHSLGGMTISGATEQAPDLVERLVYISALLPRDGDSGAALAATPGLRAEVGSYMLDDGLRVGVKPEEAGRLFYADCAEDVAAAATQALVPTDLSYMTTTVTLSTDSFGRVPKTYVHCLRDQAIEMRAQISFRSAAPGVEVREIDASHSPFLSRPAELAALLAGL
ncbi:MULTISPECIES: alpha/beta fold hydrolase [unclassified Sphingomonas]|uniref:alpha/beta fold hydrolase n=1 Tax=unclassified Sphingomonas TaxID=196159 RepID=UPI0007023AE3|nr:MULTISPECIES: alpha/beta fold hydrolase [unclassified Sphingomonas]KQX18751.1 alpha/beta hydrolase [Sphingomonas sp. Root1294]KQY71925.1 alpha/beta hydrolase [Sphingomonas sp. Root50]KRB94810.1 alpha/beta hydrolase [Sphingomonas sp. Root720]